MTDRETLSVYDARAEEYATCIGKGLEPDTQLQHFLDQLPKGAQVLDLGCGPGRSAAIMAAAGNIVTASDASAEMIRLAAQHPGVTARQETFDEISGTSEYDGVWANFSLLHADRDALPRHLGAISKALKDGGIFHIGMKTGDGVKRDGIGRSYTYVNEGELHDLLKDAGMTPFARWHGEDKGLDGVMAPWIVMQARKDG